VVTGAAGFIGSHVVEALLARGDEVVGIDNFDPYYDPAVKRSNIEAAQQHAGYVLLEGDIRTPRTLDDAFGSGRVDAVVHLAARAGVRPSIVNPQLYDSVNVRGTTAVLERAQAAGVGNVVFGSSSSVYGATTPVPFCEDEVAAFPSSPYAATKRAGEMACYAFHHIYGMDITCLRFFTVYGPRQRPEMAIHGFTQRIDRGEPVAIFGDGSSRRDYTYVADVVSGVLAAIDTPDGYRIFNLGTTRTTRLMDLVTMIAARLGRRAVVDLCPEQPGDVPVTFADISRARRELGYDPATPISEGLDRFIGWYLERRDAHLRTAVHA
jgi:UDP-glucuronate 4-epimerase